MDRSRTLNEFRVERLRGTQSQPHFQSLADLRIEVFREFPYLYEGDVEYEKKYLQRYMKTPDALVVLIWDQEHLAGAATGLPLEQEDSFIRAPFEKAGLHIPDYFYFGESLLRKSYRGKGLGHLFFDERETWAYQKGYKKTTFCAVVRPNDHSRRPRDYRPLNDFWKKRGYQPIPGLIGEIAWQDLDEKAESDKQMQFWVREK